MPENEVTKFEKHAKQMLEDTSKHLKENDTFQFKCKMCGHCCFDRNDIMLNPYDIARLKISTKMTTMEMWEKNFFTSHIGYNSGMIICTLEFNKETKDCPFLSPVIEAKDLFNAIEKLKQENPLMTGKEALPEILKKCKPEHLGCGVYPNRPTVCRLFPLGRIIKLNKKDPEDKESIYALQETGEDCGEKTETHTLKEWLDTIEWKNYDEGSQLWHSIMDKMIMSGISAKPIKEATNQRPLSEKTLSLFGNLFYNFDTVEGIKVCYDPKNSPHQTAIAVIEYIKGAFDEIMAKFEETNKMFDEIEKKVKK